MFRSCQIIIRELCSLLKLYYSIHSSIRICKRGVVAAYHVVWECVVDKQWLGVRRTVRRTPSHCSTALLSSGLRRNRSPQSHGRLAPLLNHSISWNQFILIDKQVLPLVSTLNL